MAGEITSLTLLSTTDLNVGYPGKTLLKNLNLELRSGELVCFMGPNGAGKSSLIKTLIGLNPSLGGEIHFAQDGALEKKVSVVLTTRISHPEITVEELISIGRYPYLNWMLKLNEEDASIISKAMTLTGIENLRSSKISELSDGQMQMVMIARALAQQTQIIILDEPTAHLDLNNRVEIMNLLKRLTRETNRAILMATHELDLALQTADKVWLTEPDGMIKIGIPEDLVLDGSFDRVFQWKGFDLKTGKVSHSPFKNRSFQIVGEGHELLWTRNALERNGYSIEDSASELIRVAEKNGQPIWSFEGNEFSKLGSLLQNLNAIE